MPQSKNTLFASFWRSALSSFSCRLRLCNAIIRAMTIKEKIEDNLSFLAEFVRFVRFRKRFWLLPFLIIILLLSVFIVLTESSAFAPFIYSLF